MKNRRVISHIEQRVLKNVEEHMRVSIEKTTICESWFENVK